MNPVLKRALEDEELQRSLTAADSDAALLEILRSLDLAGGDPAGLLAEAKAGLGAPLAWKSEQPPPPQWLPVLLYEDAAGLQLEWYHFGFARLTEPFFEESMRRAGTLSAQPLLRCRTSVDALLAFAAGPMPDGLVFHMSRCGSTLVAQMLAELAHVTVLSEVPAFDTALRLHLEGRLSPDHVRGLAGALGRDRHPGIRSRVFKLDAWHTPVGETVLDLFPAARAVFLHRDPVEVLVSQARRAGLHVTPGALPLARYGFRGGERVAGDDHAAWAIAEILRGGIALSVARRARPIDYAALPDALVAQILPHFGIVPEPDERTRIAQAGGRYSKDPTRGFAPDGHEKRAAAPPELVARAEAFGLPRMRERLLASARASRAPGEAGAIRLRYDFD